jgi:hypothetical protein
MENGRITTRSTLTELLGRVKRCSSFTKQKHHKSNTAGLYMDEVRANNAMLLDPYNDVQQRVGSKGCSNAMQYHKMYDVAM